MIKNCLQVRKNRERRQQKAEEEMSARMAEERGQEDQLAKGIR